MDKNLPHYLVNIILDYDGKIKYKRGKYVNVIHKYDFRYDIIKPLIDKKLEIIKYTDMDELRFYFEFSFNNGYNINRAFVFSLHFLTAVPPGTSGGFGDLFFLVLFSQCSIETFRASAF